VNPSNLVNLSRLLLLIGIIAAGCSVLAPQEDRTRFFVLTPTAGSTLVASAAAPGGNRAITVGLGPITIPRYLDRPEIVTRLNDTEFSISDTDRWAEPLGANVASVVKQDLSTAFPALQIISFPWSGKTHLDYRVSVDFHRLEKTAAGQAEVQALWTVRAADDRILQSGSATAAGLAGDNQSSASAALSRGVAQVSADIVQALARQSESKPIP
jgi:uncharacterized lipoprotein YmbA